MHPKYWKPRRLQAPMDAEGSVGGSSESLIDSFAAHFDASLTDDEQAPPVAESQDDAAARLAAEDAAAEAEKPEPQDEAPEAEAGEPQKFTIDVDGKPVELTAAEIAEHYKAGLRQADYSRKTAEAAEVRKTADAEITQARAQREEYAGKLETFTNQANYELNALRGQLTDELLQSDPVAYLQIQRTAEMRQAQLQQAHQEMQQINDQRQKEQAQAQRSHLEAQHQALLDKLPSWKDPAKAEAETAQIKKWMTGQGFKPEEIAFGDHRGVLLARKAMLYDALMARAQTTQTKVAKAPPKVARPGTPAVASTDGRSTAQRRFEQTGSREDAAAVFAEKFG